MKWASKKKKKQGILHTHLSLGRTEGPYNQFQGDQPRLVPLIQYLINCDMWLQSPLLFPTQSQSSMMVRKHYVVTVKLIFWIENVITSLLSQKYVLKQLQLADQLVTLKHKNQICGSPCVCATFVENDPEMLRSQEQPKIIPKA